MQFVLKVVSYICQKNICLLWWTTAAAYKRGALLRQKTDSSKCQWMAVVVLLILTFSVIPHKTDTVWVSLLAGSCDTHCRIELLNWSFGPLYHHSSLLDPEGFLISLCWLVTWKSRYFSQTVTLNPQPRWENVGRRSHHKIPISK